ncbi:MAG TPA: sigma-70 family RNA polymerase sigma factor [Nitrolancea sp.]
MAEQTSLADGFEANRSHLRAVAYRMLGSTSEADDAVQETWFRLSRVDADEIDNLGGWLTTVVSRVCLDMLRSRTTRREEPLDAHAPDRIASAPIGTDPEQEALMADAVGLALLVVLDSLEPAERVAFVLHDMFALPFDEIAQIVGRSSAATRQMASRARRRVRQAARMSNDEFTLQHEVASAFLNAVRAGDVEALLAVLDPDVELHAGGVLAVSGEPRTVHGAVNVASGAVRFSKHAAETYLTFVNGAVALAWMPQGEPRSVFTFHVADGRMDNIKIIDDPKELQQLKVIRLGR